MGNIVTLPNGIKIANCKPRAIIFQDGRETIIAPPYDTNRQLSATMVEAKTDWCDHIITYECVGTEEGYAMIDEIWDADSSVIILGSGIALQAYPGVARALPAPEYERVDKHLQRMRIDKFTVDASVRKFDPRI